MTHEPSPFSFVCATCGERHEGLPDLSFDAPFYYRRMSPERGGNLRPRLELEPTDHPLAVHQREGITSEALQVVFEANLHPRTSISDR